MGNYFSTQKKYNYGWKRDYYDHRDHVHNFEIKHTDKNIDLIENIDIEVYDQGNLGSCTANGIGFCYEYDEYIQNEGNKFRPSRLFIYYNEREMEGSINEDSGAQIRDGIKSINIIGVCSEKDWDYNIDKFTVKPSDECYEFATHHKSVCYRRVIQNIEQLNEALHNGFPIVFGFAVFESFESEIVATTGIVPMPNFFEKMLGGHCVVIVGIDHEKKLFKIRNSWGDKWGDNGYCYFPFDFIINQEYCSDFWTVTKIMDDDKDNIEIKNINNIKEKNQEILYKKINSDSESDLDLDSDDDDEKILPPKVALEEKMKVSDKYSYILPNKSLKSENNENFNYLFKKNINSFENKKKYRRKRINKKKYNLNLDKKLYNDQILDIDDNIPFNFDFDFDFSNENNKFYKNE